MIVTVVAVAEHAGNYLSLNDRFRDSSHHLAHINCTATGEMGNRGGMTWQIADLPLLPPLKSFSSAHLSYVYHFVI